MRTGILFIGGVGRATDYGGELTKNKNIISRLQELYIPIHVIDTYQARRKIWRLWKLPFLLLFYRKLPIVFSTSYGNIYLLHRLISWLQPNRPIILWVIGGNLHIAIKEGLYEKYLFQKLNHILVEGKAIKEGLASQGIQNVIVVPNFKEVTKLRPSKKKIYYDGIETLRVIFFSRIVPEKGCDIIIEVMKQLNRYGYESRIKLDFYGPIDESYRSTFLSNIVTLSNVEYKGILDLRSSMGYEVLNTYHLTLFPTYWSGEGFPGIIVDSFIAGLPIIASRWGINSELINERTGFLVPPHSSTEVVEILKHVLDGEIDINKLSENVTKKSSMYDVGNVISRQLIEQIL